MRAKGTEFFSGASLLGAVASALLFFAASARADNFLDTIGVGGSPSGPTGIGTEPVLRTGQPTQTQGAATAPQAVGTNQQSPVVVPAAVAATSQLQPFGASLFTGRAPPAFQTTNPDYIIQVGDTVSIKVWGGVTAETTSAADERGNVYLPNVGPIHVAGARAADLQSVVKSQLGSTFTQSVQVYAVLQQSHEVGMFVSGFVKSPGRFGGTGTDSVLDYLSMAGGVDPSRGSYRNIVLRRANRTIAQVDLYQFLLLGTLPRTNLREGDVIVVGRQQAMIAAGGAVRNNYLFELPSAGGTGRELIDLARPLPSATHAVVKGTRNNQPFAVYLTLREFASATLFDQDQVTFTTDAAPTTISVQIQGSRIGPSVLIADRETTLAELLNHVAVDPHLADTKSVYILRQSIADQQSRAIRDAIDQLEKSLYYAVSTTTGEAAIRASEAQLIASYIQTARTVQPQGRLVATDDDGKFKNIRLEDNDVIVVPEQTQTVMVSGEVTAPQAVVYEPGLTPADYVKLAGGFSQRGRDGNYMIARANGQLLIDSKAPLRPGDELIALPYIDAKNFQLVKDFAEVLYQIGIAGFTAARL